jgi:hypothetical protein
MNRNDNDALRLTAHGMSMIGDTPEIVSNCRTALNTGVHEVSLWQAAEGF